MTELDSAGSVGHGVRRGRPEAAAAIWTWQAKDRPESRSSARRLRVRGSIQAALAAGVGLAALGLGARGLGGVALTVASLVLLIALASPTGLYSAIDRAFQALGRGVGRALTWILLPAIFYLVFAPFRILFRRRGRDKMRRYFDADAASYWTRRRSPPDPSSYRRQY